MIGCGTAAAAEEGGTGIQAVLDSLGEWFGFHIEYRFILHQFWYARVRLGDQGQCGMLAHDGYDGSHLVRIDVAAVGANGVGAGFRQLLGAIGGGIAHDGSAALLFGLEGQRYQDRKVEIILTGFQGTKSFAQIEHGFNDQGVHTGLRQNIGLFPEGIVKLLFLIRALGL